MKQDKPVPFELPFKANWAGETFTIIGSPYPDACQSRPLYKDPKALKSTLEWKRTASAVRLGVIGFSEWYYVKCAPAVFKY